MKILLFGVRGLLGTALKNVCFEKKIRLYSFTSKELNVVNFKALEKKIKKIKPEIIINASALVGIDQCEKNFSKAFSINSIGALNLSRICSELNITFIQISTHAVFDGSQDRSYNENDLPKPNNVYAGTKLLSELFTKSICKKYYIVRFSMLYGNRKNLSQSFSQNMIKGLLKNKTLKIAYDKIDSPTYSKDAARALISLIRSKKPYGLYHLSNKGKVSYLKLVKKMKTILNSKSKVIPVKYSKINSCNFKPAKTSITSNKVKLRDWRKALQEYVGEIK